MKSTLFKYIYSVLFVAILPFVAWGSAEKRNFTLVIDAGHGGHDAGAVGAYSKEKNINLKVALAFGKLVEENCHGVKVVYTRKTDVFIPLQRRADIANNNKADLFVSIHTNALPNGRIAYGSETYTLGMARANANLAVAKRENSVITLESDYKSKYQGFDPNKAESYVIFEFMQDKYMKQSVDLASCIQKQYTSAGRPNKGVHQAGFLVLRNTSMPSVLTELGFITTPAEENYLNSQQGIMELSRSIYNGFLSYRRMHERGANDIPENLPTHMTDNLPEANTISTASTPTPMTTQGNNDKEVAVVPVETVPTARIVPEANDNDVARITQPTRKATPKTAAAKAEAKPATPAQAAPKEKVTPQTKATDKPKTAQPAAKEPTHKAKDSTPQANNKTAATANTKSVKAEDKRTVATKDTKNNKTTPDKSKKETEVTKNKTKKTAVNSKNDTAKKSNRTATQTKQKVTYRIQVGAGKTSIETSDPQFKGLNINRVKEGTMYKYFYGNYSTYAEAQKSLRTVRTKLSSAYIVAYVNGKAVSVAEARAKEQDKK